MPGLAGEKVETAPCIAISTKLVARKPDCARISLVSWFGGKNQCKP